MARSNFLGRAWHRQNERSESVRSAGLLPLGHFQAGQRDGQIDPFGGQFPVTLILGQLLLDLRDQFGWDVFGLALHLVGVTELVVSAGLLLGFAVLEGEAARAHGTQAAEFMLDGEEALLKAPRSEERRV